jgi:hypothetical protein
MFTIKQARAWLLAAFVVETLCATFCLKIAALSAVSSVVYFLAGISIAILVTSLPEARLYINQIAMRSGSPQTYVKTAILIGMAFAVYQLSKQAFESIDINAAYADMLPVIRTMNQRFLEGHWKKVYDAIPQIWHGTQPIYAPAMWLPFAPAVLLGFDMRWITAGCLFLAFCIFILLLRPLKNPTSAVVLSATALLLFCWLLFEDEEHGFISMSEEGVVVAYYVFLVLAVLSDQIIWIGLAASLCLLSRYALIGSVPALVCYLMLVKKNKQVLILSLTALGCFLIFFIVPFGWQSFMQVLRLPAKYIHFSGLVWKDSPEVFTRSLGFAKFFGPGNVALLHGILIAGTFLVPLCFVLLTYLKNKSRPVANLPLAALKLSTVVFYSFIDVPYLYLFYTSSFISLIGVTFLIGGERTALKTG